VKLNADFVERIKAYEKMGRRSSLAPTHWKDHPPSMFEYIKKVLPAPHVVVEVGCSHGRWSRMMLESFPSIERFFGIDVWGPTGTSRCRGADWKHDFVYLATSWFDHVRPWLFEKAFPLPGDQRLWCDAFPVEVDMVFLDGNHSKEVVLNDLHRWWPKIRSGGLVMGHDYYDEGPNIRVACENVVHAAREFFGVDGYEAHNEFRAFCKIKD